MANREGSQAGRVVRVVRAGGPLTLVRRVTHTAGNVAEFVRFGGLETDEQASPYTVEAEQATYRLRRYFRPPATGIDEQLGDDQADRAPAIVLVPPLMLTTEVWDVAPATSAVAALHRAGLDPWVVDFGHPDVEPGGLQRTLTDHVLAVSDAIDRVRAATGRPVILGGYSQGGMFAYQAAAYRRGKDIDSLVTFGSPVDTTAPLPIPIAPDVVARLAGELVDSGLLARFTLPGWASRFGFKLLSPAKSLQARVQYLLALTDRDNVLPRERQRQFLDNDGWTAWSGPAIAELLEQFVTHNRMLQGGFVIDDRLVTLADIEVPILTFVGSRDTLGHPDAVRAISQAAPRAEVYEITLPAGHFGLVVGGNAINLTWPAVANWVHWRGGTADLSPETIRADQVQPSRPLRPSAAASALAQAAELSIAVNRAVFTSVRRTARLARGVAREAPAQLPRLARLEQLDPTTRISLGRLLDEQARRGPDDIAFLFGDRAHRRRDVNERVDNIVRGLIHLGVRHGDRVGVLMNTRPSAFTVITALSRLGATAVLLRPDGEVTREARLGRTSWLIADPEHIDALAALDGDVACAVLGGGGPDARGRDALPDGVIDMERIVPADVELPAWYRPNPHRAGDVAFVLFTGEGAGTKPLQITNRRWALSALGTAAAASLHAGDTVYSVTPLHHSSALLMSIGGAVAGGARFALAGGDDPETFWEEVRRYGATHVSYTWTSLHDVAFAAPNPNERFHPIRMFIGSGMPRNLWKRVTERFPTARVVEFYASAEGEAILANLSGKRPGSMGRPIPGTAPVRVAAFDQEHGRLALGPDGLARECHVDEVGVLLAQVNPADSLTGTALRGVFAGEDAWRCTGDLFLRDEHGDLWLAGSVGEIVHTGAGAALPSGTRFAMGTIPALDLIVAYGVPDDDGDALVGAATVRPGAALDDVTTAELDAALDRLPKRQRPRYVQLVASLPVTTWHRPLWRPLQARGVPSPGRNRRVWKLGPDGAHYEHL